MNKLTLKSVFTPLFLLIFSAAFLSTLTEQVITKQVEQLVRSKDGLSSGTLWIYVFISLASAILFPIFTGMAASYSILKSSLSEHNSRISFFRFFKEHIELNLIESFRAWGKGFLWSFVFILPGIWKFISYILTPYVVMFSDRYRRGEVDALEYSAVICKKYFKRINWWLTVFYLIVPVIMFFIGEQYRLLDRTPVAASGLILFRAVTEFAFHYFMLKIFFDYINEDENGNQNSESSESLETQEPTSSISSEMENVETQAEENQAEETHEIIETENKKTE